MTRSKKTFQWGIVVLLAAILLAGAAVWYLLAVNNITDSLSVEVGSSFSASDFKIRKVKADAAFITDFSELDLTVPGDYPVEISYCGRTYDSILKLVDTVSPSVVVKDIKAFYTQEPQPEDFIESVFDYTNVTVTYAATPDMTKEGTQSVELLVADAANNVTKCTAGLNVIVDRQAPEILGVSDKILYLGHEIDLLEGISANDNIDPAPLLAIDDSQVDQTQAGTYTVIYTATDVCGNETVQSAALTVINDSQGPAIYGVNKLSIYQGSTVSYRSGVVVTDNYDEAPVLSIDSSDVNLNEPGTYDVVFTAKDAAGNETTVSTTITIKEKKSSYVEESVIYAMADECLAKFITDDMTVEDQIRAVYKWVRSNYRYANSYDKVDRLQGAYHMMKTGGGDCFNFYAVCSVFFERLEIPQISVRRSSNSGRGTRHYWSMVSLDGGETYYHFDSCPTTFFSANTCLLTDAGLKKINKIAPGYFAMDPGVYPATPEEEL